MNSLKKLLPLAAALCLLLSACGGGGAAVYDGKTVEALLDSGAFSVELTATDASLLYDFEGYGVDTAVLDSATAYSVSGLAEQVAVLTAKDEAGAKSLVDMLQTYVADLKDSYRDYAPNEVPKLDDAIIDQRGNSVLLVVPNDQAKAQSAVDALGK